MGDFHHERVIKSTRGVHVCEQCGTVIEIGSKAYHHAGVYWGDFYSSYQHVECQAAGNAYAEMTGCWGEDYMWFQHQLEDRDDELWLLENYPIVAGRLGLTQDEVVS